MAEELVGDFQGYLQTDGFAGYNALGETREGIIHVGCLAHVRRKFVEALKAGSKKSSGGTAQTVVDLIGKLYHLEKQAQDAKCNADQVSSWVAEYSELGGRFHRNTQDPRSERHGALL
ncbi:Mobile element protein [Desulfovibrio sp. TomC]|nr:Mobile element protein [Desulfovibrio sp. TomC]